MNRHLSTRDHGFLGIHLRLTEGEMALVSRRLDLQDRQKDVTGGLLAGSGAEDLADSLGVALEAASDEIQRLYDHLGIKTRVELAMLVLKILAGDPEQSQEPSDRP